MRVEKKIEDILKREQDREFSILKIDDVLCIIPKNSKHTYYYKIKLDKLSTLNILQNGYYKTAREDLLNLDVSKFEFTKKPENEKIREINISEDRLLKGIEKGIYTVIKTDTETITEENCINIRSIIPLEEDNSIKIIQIHNKGYVNFNIEKYSDLFKAHVIVPDNSLYLFSSAYSITVLLSHEKLDYDIVCFLKEKEIKDVIEEGERNKYFTTLLN